MSVHAPVSSMFTLSAVIYQSWCCAAVRSQVLLPRYVGFSTLSACVYGGCIVSCILCHLSLSLSLSGSGSKSATGLLEWLEIDSALDAFVMTNHQTAFSQSKYMYFTPTNPRMLPVRENRIILAPRCHVHNLVGMHGNCLFS